MGKGFTLIELLIVIGVLAILATFVTLVLNPAEKLREARDVKRITDLRTVKGAISFYLVQVSQPTGEHERRRQYLFARQGASNFC